MSDSAKLSTCFHIAFKYHVASWPSSGGTQVLESPHKLRVSHSDLSWSRVDSVTKSFFCGWMQLKCLFSDVSSENRFLSVDGLKTNRIDFTLLPVVCPVSVRLVKLLILSLSVHPQFRFLQLPHSRIFCYLMQLACINHLLLTIGLLRSQIVKEVLFGL